MNSSIAKPFVRIESVWREKAKAKRSSLGKVFSAIWCFLALGAAMPPNEIDAQDQRLIDDPAKVFTDSPASTPVAGADGFQMSSFQPQTGRAGINFPFGPGQAAQLGSLGIARPNTPKYNILRYDEDYSFLRNPALRTDFLDPLKFIPLKGRSDHFLSLGGEVREWFESYHNDGFGAGPANANGYNTYFLQRYMLHADWHLGSNWRVFVQSISGQEDGRIGGPRPDIDVNEFDIHQAFVDRIFTIDEGRSVTWRVGRQEFRYGSGRLIDVREGPNLRLAFDAVRALAKLNDWAVDAWIGKPVLNNPGVLDDDPNPAISFWGLYGTGPLRDENELSVDLYYLGYQNQQAQFNNLSGSELRHSVGTRIWGRPNNWEYNLEYVYQFGTFGAGNINAWTAANAARYNFVDRPFTPATGVRFDVASGDQNPNSQNLQTFNPMFPSGCLFQPGQPIWSAEHHRPASDSRSACQGKRDALRRLDVFLAREPARRRLPTFRIADL